MTSVEGIFATGNVLHVHDLVDNVSEESRLTGGFVADYLAGKRPARQIRVKAGSNVRYVNPSQVDPGRPNRLYLRPLIVKNKAELTVRANGRHVRRRVLNHVQPSEMISVMLRERDLADISAGRDPGGVSLMKKELTCISCPVGCAMTAEFQPDGRIERDRQPVLAGRAVRPGRAGGPSQGRHGNMCHRSIRPLAASRSKQGTVPEREDSRGPGSDLPDKGRVARPPGGRPGNLQRGLDRGDAVNSNVRKQVALKARFMTRETAPSSASHRLRTLLQRSAI